MKPLTATPHDSNENEKSFTDLLKKEGYFDKQGNLHREFVQRKNLESLAEQMAQDGLTMSQLRRYFQHCRTIESQIKSGQATWEHLVAKFDKMDSVAENAVNMKKIPKLFYLFLKTNVAAVKTEKDFLEGFLPHFEAFVGFAAGHIRN